MRSGRKVRSRTRLSRRRGRAGGQHGTGEDGRSATDAATGNAAPFSLDTAPGRLPKDVVPLDYTIAIVPDLEAKTFTGTERVTLQVRAPAARLVFKHAMHKGAAHEDLTEIVKYIERDAGFEMPKTR